jgi:hypothetical protein
MSESLTPAARAGSLILNARFVKAPCEELDAPADHYDGAVCKHGLADLASPLRGLKELHRVLKRGAQVSLVEWDGAWINLFPVTPGLRAMLERLRAELPVDFELGRKLPSLAAKVGFQRISWETEAVQFTGTALSEERKRIEQRMIALEPAIVIALGGERHAAELRRRYLSELEKPGTVLFYNRFMINGWK